METYDTNKTNAVTIGYYDDKAVYLLPNETWHMLQQYCLSEGFHFPFSESTFFQMLKDKGLIAPDKKGQLKMQKKINKINHRVLKIVGGEIYEKFVTSATDVPNN